MANAWRRLICRVSDVILMSKARRLWIGGPIWSKRDGAKKWMARPWAAQRMHNAVSGVAHYRSKDDEVA